MPLHFIESIDDQRIRHYRDLPGANLTERSGLFVVEGWRLAERLIKSNFIVESILVEESRLASIRNSIPEEISVYVAPAGMVEQVIGFNFHRGVLACGRRKPLRTVQEVLTGREGPITVVVCEDIHDPTNVGSIVRSCAAFGIDLLILNQRSADPYSRRVLRVSMGTVLQIPIVRSRDFLADLECLRSEHDIELVAAVLDPGAEQLPLSPRKLRMGLLIGNEANGLSQEVLALCQRRVTLEMNYGTDSLNAAVATGVLLYHFTSVAKVDLEG